MNSTIDFPDACYGLREELKAIAPRVLILRRHPAFTGADTNAPLSRDLGEMLANIMLAYRHLEDAAMRLGKAVQAYDGGASVYPR
jgi:hypothetical protein